MNSKIATVDYLLDLFQKLSNDGHGDMKIKFQDGFLHEDEVSVNFQDEEVLLQGLIFNIPITEKIKEFKSDIQKAYEKFYDIESEE